MSTRGLFVVFEGGDGVGKTTQIARAADWLRSAEGGGFEVITTREPGGTDLGRDLRAAVMHGGHVVPKAEALLYAADRAHHVETVVVPALARGGIVLQDRYLDSSAVYQGVMRGLGDEVERISLWAVGGLLPDLTVVLDMDPDPARLGARLDRLERDALPVAEDIRAAFLRRAGLDPGRYAVVDATGGPDEVQGRVREALEPLLEACREAV